MKVFKEPLRFLREQSVKLTPDELAQGFRAQIKVATSWPDKAADFLTSWFGTVGFLFFNAAKNSGATGFLHGFYCALAGLRVFYVNVFLSFLLGCPKTFRSSFPQVPSPIDYFWG